MGVFLLVTAAFALIKFTSQKLCGMMWLFFQSFLKYKVNKEILFENLLFQSTINKVVLTAGVAGMLSLLLNVYR